MMPEKQIEHGMEDILKNRLKKVDDWRVMVYSNTDQAYQGYRCCTLPCGRCLCQGWGAGQGRHGAVLVTYCILCWKTWLCRA